MTNAIRRNGKVNLCVTSAKTLKGLLTYMREKAHQTRLLINGHFQFALVLAYIGSSSQRLASNLFVLRELAFHLFTKNAVSASEDEVKYECP